MIEFRLDCRRRIFICVFFISAVFFGCQKAKDNPSVSFYYWKTVFKLSDKETSIMKTLKVNKIYIRYFDVVWDGKQAIPNAPIDFSMRPPSVEIIPVVFIRNNVLETGGADVVLLTGQISNYISQIDSAAGVVSKEIQIDCDWNETSQKRFMQLISLLKQKTGKRISTTIRLHQIKYRERTGVPPADHGVLMYYNMGELGSTEHNSIYSRRIAQKYLSRLSEYPLVLTPALPIFGWTVHKKDGRVIGVVNKTGVADFKADTNFVQIKQSLFIVNNSHVKAGMFFQKGDTMVCESVTPTQLMEMVSDLSDQLAKPPAEVIFYDLDELNFYKFGINESDIAEACSGF